MVFFYKKRIPDFSLIFFYFYGLGGFLTQIGILQADHL